MHLDDLGLGGMATLVESQSNSRLVLDTINPSCRETFRTRPNSRLDSAWHMDRGEVSAAVAYSVLALGI